MAASTTPTYCLTTIQGVFSKVSNLRMTGCSKQGATSLGFTDQDIVDAIQALLPGDFYKTMPPKHANFSAMQDVYKSTYKGKGLYIKFQLSTNGHLLLQFKEK